MAAEIQIVSTLDNDQTIAGFVETEKKAKDTAAATGKATKANKSFQQQLAALKKEQDGLDLDERMKRVKEVFDNAAPSVDKLTAEVKEYQSLALAAGRTSPIGREFLEKAAIAKDTLIDLQNETKRLSDDNRNLAGAIQGIGAGVSAFAGVTAAAALFGGENEALQKTLTKVMAAQTLLNSVQQIQIAFQKESSLRLSLNNGLIVARTAAIGLLAAVQTAYNAIVGTSTGAMKGFKLALIGTGIGAIVIGLGLLIANFESIVTWVGSAVESIGGLRTIILILLGPIGLLIAAWDWLFGEEERLEEQRKRNSAANSARTVERIKEIKEEQKAFVDATEKENEILEVKVKILENEGEASDEVRLKILENNRAVVQSHIDAVRQVIEAKTRQYKTEAALRGQSEEEFIAAMKSQGLDLVKIQDQANEIVNDLQLKVELSESEITKFKREQNEQRVSNVKSVAKQEIKINDDLLKRRIEAISQLDQLEIEAIEDRQEREEILLQAKFEKNIANLSENISEEKDLIFALEEKFLNDLKTLQEKFASEELSEEFKDGQKLDELKIKLAEGRRVVGLEQFVLDKEIASLRFLEEIENLNFELQIKELTEEEFKIRKETLVQDHQNTLTEIEREGSEARTKQAFNEANKKIETIEFFVNGAASINKSFNTIQDNQLKQGEDLSLKFQKRRFQREKAFNIASALINGAGAVMKSIATYGPPPSPLGIAGIAAAGIITAAQVAAIASANFNPSGGSGGSLRTPSIGSIGSGGGVAIPAPTPNIPTAEVGGIGSSANEEIFNQKGTIEANAPIVKTYVLSGDLTTAAEAERLIEEQSTL